MIMQGYDKEAAVAFILKAINRKEHAALADQLETLIPQIIDADMAYMLDAGVLDEDGYAGDAYYEDDDALEFMVDAIIAKSDMTPEQAIQLASLVDEYMSLQQLFLENSGLVDYGD